MDRTLTLVLRDAVETARARGRALARIVFAGAAADRVLLRQLADEHGLVATEIELVPAEGPPRLLALELAGRAQALNGVGESPRQR